jgi:large subunit ribosomal protein L32e
MKKLIDIKKEQKRKMPKFVRDEAFKRKEIGTAWRKPRGQCNKSRKEMAGHAPIVKVGYKTPAALRGMSREGKKLVRVDSAACLANLKKGNIAILASGMGMRKKIPIIKEIIKVGATIQSIKKPEDFIKEFEKKCTSKKDARKSRVAARVVKPKTDKKDEKKPAKKEAKADAKATEEPQAEKKELDKILTKKQ